METPTLEFYETVGVQSAIEEQQLFKLLDQDGKTLVLRPDMTGPIARVAASAAQTQSSAQSGVRGKRLSRSGAGRRTSGRIRTGRRGADRRRINKRGRRGDCAGGRRFENAGLHRFKIAIGHAGLADELFVEVLGNAERADVLRRFLFEKNYVGYREHVKSLPLSSIDKAGCSHFWNCEAGKKSAPRRRRSSASPDKA